MGSKRYLAVDVGEKRLGLAVANSIAKIPSSYSILPNDTDAVNKISDIVNKERIDSVIVGLPRDFEGLKTAQTEFSEQFAHELKKTINCEIVFADESLSSIRAESEQKYRSTDSSKHFDDVAACYILEEFLEQPSI